MNPKDFVALEAGRLVRTARGNPAFAPAPLPPQIDFDQDLVLTLSRADTALAELSAYGKQLPNPHLLISPYVRREAVLSSRIEGTQASLSDVLIDELEDAPRKPSNADDVKEVRNYVRALEHGIERLGALPLSLGLVKELHQHLMEGVRGSNKTPGEFRTGQNIVGSQGHDEVTAPYVPPPVPEMQEALAQWERYLNEPDGLPVLVQCALMHVQFESIHPFWDGNGRVGRLLITLFLVERRRLSQPLLYLSAYIEDHRQDYYELLQRTRTHGDWVSWLAMALIDHLLTNPYLTISRAERLLNVSQPTARTAVLTLEKMKLVTEVTGRQWGRVYVAKRILDVIDVKSRDQGGSHR